MNDTDKALVERLEARTGQEVCQQAAARLSEVLRDNVDKARAWDMLAEKNNRIEALSARVAELEGDWDCGASDMRFRAAELVDSIDPPLADAIRALPLKDTQS